MIFESTVISVIILILKEIQSSRWKEKKQCSLEAMIHERLSNKLITITTDFLSNFSEMLTKDPRRERLVLFGSLGESRNS